MSATEAQVIADRFIRVMARIEAIPAGKINEEHRFATERCRDTAYLVLRHAIDMAFDQVSLAREIMDAAAEIAKKSEVANG